MIRIALIASAAFILPIGARAETITCTPTPDCQSLGYTETSCSEGSGIKCPWGDKWACISKNQETDNNCTIGSILYSDKSCSQELLSNKTPIGVVVYVDGYGGGQAIALDVVDVTLGNFKVYKWATDSDIWDNTISVSGSTVALPLKQLYIEEAIVDFASCENSKKIMSAGDKTQFPAVWAAYEYKTEGTNSGDWCLPAAGIFNSIKRNQETIDAGLDKAGGLKTTEHPNAWSSSVSQASHASWHSCLILTCTNGDGLSSLEMSYNSNVVRPVIEF